ncbi:hypothetical protein MLD38_014771 [Melastoma candidum]|uniref:Uncharacterized protein n=1 Tax=Melastoma candidum TaxID=119954 RepID=A0ACB9RDS0_9MYRT|nr:hypothetical protein MLD38_014771 [Melastoma candidum]
MGPSIEDLAPQADARLDEVPAQSPHLAGMFMELGLLRAEGEIQGTEIDSTRDLSNSSPISDLNSGIPKALHLWHPRAMAGSSVQDRDAMRKILLDEGYVDNQFVQLEQLVDNECPNFAQEVMVMYIEDSAKFVQNIERWLEEVPVNFVELDKALHQLKGSSASVGANRVRIQVNRMRDLGKENNAESCKEALKDLKRERAELKDKMENYFKLPKVAAPSPSAGTPSITGGVAP